MTNTEFAMEMDVIYENINKGGGVGLDTYEKSVILTKAQEVLVIELANSDISILASLIKTVSLSSVLVTAQKIDSRSIIYKLPAFLKILEESMVPVAPPTKFLRYSVIPLQFPGYQSLLRKPYSYPPKRTAFRLVNTNLSPEINPSDETSPPPGVPAINGEPGDGYIPVAEILMPPNSPESKYVITVLMYPTPIILADLEVGESIRGISDESVTSLNESLHPLILDKAVMLAEQYYYDKYPQEKE